MKALLILVAISALGLVSAQYDYNLALKKSILFYEAQRSGKLINNRIDWRGDTFLNDGSDVGVDLSGGYFDAGDHVKFGFPFAHSMIFLAWGMIDYRSTYQAAGELDNGLAALRWGADWILKATKLDQGKVYGQAGNGGADHAYWGRPEDWPASQVRPSYAITTSQPGTDLAANYASALAAASVAIGSSDATYSANLLNVAKQLYDFAKNYRGIYSNSISDAGAYYRAYAYEDELTFAAAMLALATNEQTYKTDAANFWNQFGYGTFVQTFFDWDNKMAGIAVLLSRILGDQKYKTSAQDHCEFWINSERRTPKGLVFINEWGSLRHASNAAFGCLLVADSGIGNAAAYKAFAKQQIDYALGSTGRSFVVGFGNNPPVKCHHRGASCPDAPAPCGWNEYNSPNPNGQVLEGALVGGPDINDYYNDARDDYRSNEVALDYNAGFQSALAGLINAGY
ncbi:endoglucanase F [Daphnia magna]|uniref:Endoglucanase n=2 Tax=Daphnia magna TaxID=35525 RepID=A0A0P5ZYA7_9CRUS|nr:endoglucanase F [Daphnia magna]KAK4008784.1 hypothetical protein OUZ56_013912 [Daphnia magna]KZS03923.1 Endoglucanase [Daphnia magna]